MSYVLDEIATQPAIWRRAAAVARSAAHRLPAAGQRAAIVGCGTSLFMAEAWAAAREQAGQGETDAFTPSEAPSRPYDTVVVLTRSGTTTEVLDYVRGLAGAGRTVGSPVRRRVRRRALRRELSPQLRRRALCRPDALRHDGARPGAGSPGPRRRSAGRRGRGGARRAAALRPGRCAAVRVPRPRPGRRRGARGRPELREAAGAGPRPTRPPSSATARSARSTPPASSGRSAPRRPAWPTPFGHGRHVRAGRPRPHGRARRRPAPGRRPAESKGLDPDHPCTSRDP